jgi:hypothetical protein
MKHSSTGRFFFVIVSALLLEDYVTSLKQAMTQEMLQDSVIAIHQEQGEHFKAYEAAVVATST